jgi:hypothetical protein
MRDKHTWVRWSTSDRSGRHAGRWHLLGPGERPWCGKTLTGLPSTRAQRYDAPGGSVCRTCVRAQRRADRLHAREARAAAKAARGTRVVTRRPTAA